MNCGNASSGQLYESPQIDPRMRSNLCVNLEQGARYFRQDDKFFFGTSMRDTGRRVSYIYNSLHISCSFSFIIALI